MVAPEWDPEADPQTNGELWTSWLKRGQALDLAVSNVYCLKQWSDDTREALRGSPSASEGG